MIKVFKIFSYAVHAQRNSLHDLRVLIHVNLLSIIHVNLLSTIYLFLLVSTFPYFILWSMDYKLHLYDNFHNRQM